VTERESEPYDEFKVMENIAKQGGSVIEAHLAHLKDHGQDDLLAQAVQFMKERGIRGEAEKPSGPAASGCPGTRSAMFEARGESAAARPAGTASAPAASELAHWPVQLHLISPTAPQYGDKDVVLSADCVAYAIGDFHARYLKGKSLAIACPKLDEGKEIYLEKLVQLIDTAHINTLSVLTMEVPCCRGLLVLAQEAQQKATRKVPVKSVVVSIRGEVLQESWV
jgi:hypothetical protein